MALSMSDERIKRLNRLLVLLRDKPHTGSDELMKDGKYPSSKALQGDIHFLRKAFNVKIVYSRREHGYRLENTGDFALLLKSESEGQVNHEAEI